ncbi:MAG: hypothetical protein V5A43_05575, partial [Haloarculaceae archaeon]
MTRCSQLPFVGPRSPGFDPRFPDRSNALGPLAVVDAAFSTANSPYALTSLAKGNLTAIAHSQKALTSLAVAEQDIFAP